MLRSSCLPRAVVARPLPRALSTQAPVKPKLPVEPTTFSAKSQPREVYYRPENQRGMPAEGAPRAPWEQLKRASPAHGAKGDPEEAFAGPSRPRMYYGRPGERELPKVSSRIPWFIALGLLGIGVWGAFILQATNAERLASSVLRQVNFQLRNSNDVRALLGEGVHLEPNWWGLGEPWISGSINMMQGRVDLSFRLIGSKGTFAVSLIVLVQVNIAFLIISGAGTVYFTSIRPQQEGAWRIVRYKVIADSGEVLRLEDKVERERFA